MPALYSDLADWWPLLSDPADYADEAAHHWRVMTRHARREIRTLLELGCGGGNNASHLKRHCRPTLTDASPQMLAVSRRLNPDCEHVQGDMRTLRLGRTFDAVFVHDAVMYLPEQSDLRQTLQTAFEHLAPGGVALLVPDCTRETWSPSTSHGGHDGDGRALRDLAWTWDPDPSDTRFTVDMVMVLREADGGVRVHHDRHQNGLFPRDLWMSLLQDAGFDPRAEPCAYPGGEPAASFVGLHP